MAQQPVFTDYGFSQALTKIPPQPIISKISPSVNNQAALGTLWINTLTNQAWVLVSVLAGIATWNLLESGGAGGAFTTLTSSGATTLDTTTAAANTFGNIIGTTSVDILVGTGGFGLDGVATSDYAIGASTVGGTISIGGSAQTGAITIGSSTAAQDVKIAAGSGISTLELANGAGGNLIEIGNGIGGNTIEIGNGANDSAQIIDIANGASDANSTVNILNGAATAGTQIFNVLAAGATQAGDVNIGTGAAGHVVNLGSTHTTAETNINGGATDGINLVSAGNVSMVPGTVSAAAYVATLNTRVGQVALTGQTLGATDSQALVITNSLVVATSSIFVTVTNGGTQTALIQVQGIVLTTDTITITVTNVGAQALNGNIYVNYWILD